MATTPPPAGPATPPLRFPAPLRPGDRIGVTALSAGADEEGLARLRFAADWFRARGLETVFGDCLAGGGHVSAPKQARAAELTAMLCDPGIRAIVPPWGGPGTALDVLDQLDWDAIRAAEPTWVVGYSDIVAALVPLTLHAGLPTLHGDSFADSPYRVPDGLAHWTALAASPGGPVVQEDSGIQAFWAPLGDARATEWESVRPGGWELHAGSRDDDAAHRDGLDVTGTLIGGCIEVLAGVAGTPYADIRAFSRAHGPTIVYLEAADEDAFVICRNLHHLRYAGWFEDAAAVLIGRTMAPAGGAGEQGMTQRQAVLDALGDLRLPIVFDLEIGHVPPHLPLLNGARARVEVRERVHRITQTWG